MSFFENVRELCYEKPTFEKDLVAYTADPIKAAKKKLLVEARKQIQVILDGNKQIRGGVKWYNNGYVSFRLGRFPLVLSKDSKPIYGVPASSEAEAMTVIRAFEKGVEDGEFDNSIKLLSNLLDLKRLKELPNDEIEHSQALIISKTKDLSKLDMESIRKAIQEILVKPE